MAENKLRPTDEPIAEFLGNIPDPQRRADAETLVGMMERLSGEPATVWGYGIVGFGTYRYRYDSGREGEAGRVGFSPRARELVVYLNDGYAGRGEQLARLGKHKIGKSCLYIKRLSDVDEGVLEEMIRDSLTYMDEKYPRYRQG